MGMVRVKVMVMVRVTGVDDKTRFDRALGLWVIG